MLNIVGNRYIFFTLSGVVILVALFLIVGFGFREGIEFTGGTLWEFRTPGVHTTPDALQSMLEHLGVHAPEVTFNATANTYSVRSAPITEADHSRYTLNLKSQYPSFDERGFQSIGPSVGKALRQNALFALILVLLGISLYIAFAFRKLSRPIASWKYGVVTLLTLFHDVVIPAGLLALLGHYGKVELDGNFVVALLVVAGFSVHDTIVVFDRIRENLLIDRGKTHFGIVINQSVNQTLGRSVNTSLTLILVLLALYFTGPIHLQFFVLTLLVGVTTGIYSSIFVASPLLLSLQPRK